MGSYSKVCGPSSISPYVPGENPQDRHLRREQEAYLRRDWLEKFCRLHGLQLVGRGDWKTWHVRGKVNAKWIPRTGELTVNRDRAQPIKCYDVLQLSRELMRHLT